MPTIKTIKPAGGGDYTTLQAWEDYADGQATADQWAECYTGNLGSVVVQTWTATPSASNYPKIYVASGQSCTIDCGGINHGIVNAIAYTQVVGTAGSLTITNWGGLNNGIQNNAANVLFDGVIVDGTGVSFAFGIALTGGSTEVRNCVVLNAGFQGVYASGGTHTLNNCTIYNCGNGGFGGAGLDVEGATCTSNNNASFNNNVDYAQISGTLTCTNCASSDGTADDFGGSGNLVDLVAADCFTDAANDDFTLKAGSALKDAGTTIGSNTTDIVGNTRPRGAAYDIGAYEAPAAYAETALGGIVLGGSTTITQAMSNTASGGIVLGGTTQAGLALTHTASGGIVLGGSTTATRVVGRGRRHLVIPSMLTLWERLSKRIRRR